jgi:hypothetical protein
MDNGYLVDVSSSKIFKFAGGALKARDWRNTMETPDCRDVTCFFSVGQGSPIVVH